MSPTGQRRGAARRVQYARPIVAQPAQDLETSPRPVAEPGAADQVPAPARPRLRTSALPWAAALVLQGVAELVYLRPFLSRPLAFDEQWRAYYVSLGTGLFGELDGVPAPMTAGWVAMQNAVVALLPNNEWALRLPLVASIVGLGVATFVLARRVVPDLVAWAGAALVLLNGPVLAYGLLMKQFVFEAFIAVVCVIAWYGLQRTDLDRTTRLLGYAGLGVATIFATSALFFLAPLLALDLLRSRPLGQLRQRLVEVAIPAVLALVHLRFFFLRQASLLDEPYWQLFFAPRSTEVLPFLREQAEGFLKLPSTVYLAPDTRDQYLAASTPPGTGLAPWLGVAFAAALVWGTITLARTRLGRPIVVATLGALAIQFVASLAEKWPFGMVRSNLLLVPLLYVIAAAGLHDGWRRLRQLAPAPARQVASVALAIVFAVPALATAAVDAQAIREYKARFAVPVFVDGMRDVVREARRAAGPEDVVIAVLNRKGWSYYANAYDDPVLEAEGVSRVPDERTLYIDDFTSPEITRFVDAHSQARRVVLFDFHGIGPVEYERQAAWLAERGYCPTDRRDYEQTGILTVYTRGSTPCPGPSAG
jgi:hypothetical protein